MNGSKGGKPSEIKSLEIKSSEGKEPNGIHSEPKVSGAENLEAILQVIRKEKGEKIAVPANKILPVKRLPTGMFDLDFALGGGFPFGRYSIIYGPESSGKTNIALRAVSQIQRCKCVNKAVWLNVEPTFDPIWGKKMGVDIKELIIVNPSYGEEAVDVFDAVVRAGDVGLVVVDSLAALIANKEIAQSVEAYDIGSSALLIKRMVNKLMIAFGEEAKKNHFPCVLLINQTRFKPGVVFGDPEVMPGGEAQKFLSSLRIRTSAKNEIDKATNQILLKEIHVIVKKAKVPVRAIDFRFKMCVTPHDGLSVGDTDSFALVKSYLEGLGFLTKVTNKGWFLKTIPTSYPTLNELRGEYLKNKTFALKLQTMVNDAMQEMLLVEEAVIQPVVTPGHPHAVSE